MIQSGQFKDEAVFNWFRKKDETMALFLYHIFPTEYREATERLKGKGIKLPNPSHSKYGNILKDKEFVETLRALLKVARDTKRKSAWGRRHTPSTYLTSGPFPLSAPCPPTVIAPAKPPAPTPISPSVVLPTVLQVATLRPGPELPVTHVPPRPPSPPKYHPSNLPFRKALEPLLWSQHHRCGFLSMEYFKEPAAPDPDQTMLSPDQLAEEPAKPPDSDIPMISPFIPYQPNPTYTQNPSYELQPRE